jgi:hypothetical protein
VTSERTQICSLFLDALAALHLTPYESCHARCDEVARYVAERAPGICRIGKVDSYFVRHFFVAANGLYFDGQHVDGVKRLKDLFDEPRFSLRADFSIGQVKYADPHQVELGLQEFFARSA